VQSTDFPSIVDPRGVGRRPLAAGGRAEERPKAHVVIVMPHPILGALALAALHHRIRQHIGALQQAAQRR
jgi:hypothetical protein